jgi:SAM-dependent methyltransferase
MQDENKQIVRLNLGCGQNLAESWVNVDYAMGARLARIPVIGFIAKKMKIFARERSAGIFLHDLTKPFPWEDCSVDVVYSSHTLEHFTRDDGKRFLEESYRVLRKGGLIRIVVPDLLDFIGRYESGEIKAEDFVDELGVLYAQSGRPLRRKLAPWFQFPHKCMYDTPALVRTLEELGFSAASMPPFASEIDGIDGIEIEDRTVGAVIVEGRKMAD